MLMRLILIVSILTLSYAIYDSSLPSPILMHDLKPSSTKKHTRHHQLQSDPAIKPLFPGYGTHFAYVYVGTPPQRQSLIVDTGSSFTAFPCVGCGTGTKSCGEHTDPYFNYEASSSKSIPKCQSDVCHMSMKYTEGSSWDAFAIVDQFYVGSLIDDHSSPAYPFANYFACQTSVTGLFETQLADGILGLAMTPTALPFQMQAKKVADNKIFALCFRNGGGIFTLAGVDQRLHTSSINYAKLIPNANGLYMFNLLDISIAPISGDAPLSLHLPLGLISADNAAVLDSGTTDSYFPEALLAQFAVLFHKTTGVFYSNDDLPLTDDQLSSLPDMLLTLEDTNHQPFTMRIPVTSYVEDVGEGKYAFRLYFTEKTGAILGANFMTGNNVIFDADAMRIGFASSTCDYERFGTLPDILPVKPPSAETSCIEFEECTAFCGIGSSNLATGIQVIRDTCKDTRTSADCHISCDTNGKAVRGDPTCPDTPWSECSESCVQTRSVAGANCKMKPESRSCSSGACPVNPGDFIALLDLKVSILPKKWSYVYAETFVGALETLFQVPAGSIDLLNDASTEFSREVRLHFEIHLQASSYKSPIEFRKAAELIPVSANSPSFAYDFLKVLGDVSARTDKIDYNRYGYLHEKDVTVLKAVALPIGYSRDLDHQHKPLIPAMTDAETIVLIAVGVAVGLIIMLIAVCCCYCQLKAQHEALSKDKLMGGSLRRMWERFQNVRQKRRERNVTLSTARVPLMSARGDDQLDEEDLSQLRV